MITVDTKSLKMEVPSEFMFSMIYGIVAFCFVFPAKEFTSLGFTVQNLFSSYLGSEHMDFVGYHMKRTTITLLIHSLIPLGYCIGLIFVAPNIMVFDYRRPLGLILLVFSVILALIGILITRLWTWRNWEYHPLVKLVAAHGSPWRAVAAQINLEFRRVNKFSSVSITNSLYVTDSWILNCCIYCVNVAQQTDTHLSVNNSEEYDLSHETQQPTQFVSIKVYSINPKVKPFCIRLNSLEYNDLKDKLQAPLRNARNVVIRQSLSERFLEAFRAQTELNGRCHYNGNPEDLEPCIGCMQKQSNIKLAKSCRAGSEGQCMQCYCRPMWCLECMGKWYASRQDQGHPETWMGGSAPCPTCRANFCMLDVKLIYT